MAQRIVLIDGHPDPDPTRFCHALGSAYADGARTAGHDVRRIAVAELNFPILRTELEWQRPPTAAIGQAQTDIAWAEHLVIVFPLWLGSMPALLKGFLEQVMRPGFAFEHDPVKRLAWKKLLTGRSARVVVTMGMPALIYRWYFFAHSLKSLERNILGFCGIGPIKETLIGGMGSLDDASRRKWLERLRDLGREAR